MQKIIIVGLCIIGMGLLFVSGCYDEKPPYCKYGINDEDRCMTLDEVKTLEEQKETTLERIHITSGCKEGCWMYDALVQINHTITIDEHNYLIMKCVERCHEK